MVDASCRRLDPWMRKSTLKYQYEQCYNGPYSDQEHSILYALPFKIRATQSIRPSQSHLVV